MPPLPTIWAFYRTHYLSGEPKTVMRGWLHCLGLWANLGMAAHYHCHWTVAAMFLAKALSYGSSACYHLYPGTSVDVERWLLNMDVISISVAIWAPSVPYATAAHEFWWSLGALMMSLVMNAGLLLSRDFAWHYLGRRDPRQVYLARNLLLFLYFWSVVLHIGAHVGYGGSALWVAGIIFYLHGFLVSSPVVFGPDEKRGWKMPWHASGVYGFHEDFHASLAVADCCYLYLGVRYVTERVAANGLDPSCW